MRGVSEFDRRTWTPRRSSAANRSRSRVLFQTPRSRPSYTAANSTLSEVVRTANQEIDRISFYGAMVLVERLLEVASEINTSDSSSHTACKFSSSQIVGFTYTCRMER